jgi:predicted phage gp36 major capsid-like protein
MQQRSVIERVEILERKVEVLETLPERVTAVELQLVQLRDEMRVEFSATRAEMRAGDEEIHRTLRAEIREGDEETRRYMRVLYEDLVARISLLQEGRSRPRKESDPER